MPIDLGDLSGPPAAQGRRLSQLGQNISRAASLLGQFVGGLRSARSAFEDADAFTQFITAQSYVIDNVNEFDKQLEQRTDYENWGTAWDSQAASIDEGLTEILRSQAAKEKFGNWWLGEKQRQYTKIDDQRRMMATTKAEATIDLEIKRAAANGDELRVRDLAMGGFEAKVLKKETALGYVAEYFPVAHVNDVKKQLEGIELQDALAIIWSDDAGDRFRLSPGEVDTLRRDFTDRAKAVREEVQRRKTEDEKVAIDAQAMLVAQGRQAELNPVAPNLSAGDRIQVTTWKNNWAKESDAAYEQRMVKDLKTSLQLMFDDGRLTTAILDEESVQSRLPFTDWSALRADVIKQEAQKAKDVQVKTWQQNEYKWRELLETGGKVDGKPISASDIIADGRSGNLDPVVVDSLLTLRRQMLPGAPSVEETEDRNQFTLEMEIDSGVLDTDAKIATRVQELGFRKPNAAKDEAVKYLQTKQEAAAAATEKAHAEQYATVVSQANNEWDNRLRTVTTELEAKALVAQIEVDGTKESEFRPEVFAGKRLQDWEAFQTQWKDKAAMRAKELKTKEDNSIRISSIVYDFSRTAADRETELRLLMSDKVAPITGDDYAEWAPRITDVTKPQQRYIDKLTTAYELSMEGQEKAEAKATMLELIQSTNAMIEYIRAHPEPSDEPMWDRQVQLLLSDKNDADILKAAASAFGATTVPKLPGVKGAYQATALGEALREIGQQPVGVQIDPVKLRQLVSDVLEAAGLVRKRLGVPITPMFPMVLQAGAYKGETVYSVGKEFQVGANGRFEWNDSIYMVRTPIIDGVYTSKLYHLDPTGAWTEILIGE